MKYQLYILSLAVVLVCLAAPQSFSAQPSTAVIIGPDSELAPPPDVGSKSIDAARPADEKKVAEADLRQESADPSPMKDDSRTAPDSDSGYRPLCGPSKNAINHVYCAPGYDVY